MNDFEAFFNAMKAEYMRPVPLKGDTWKTCDIDYLWNKLEAITLHIQFNNVDHLLDVANMCAMIWVRYHSSNQTAKSDEE